MSMPQLQSTPIPAHAASPIRRWWLRLGFLLVVASVVLHALVVPASEASAANVEWTVINVNSGKCLDVVGASTADQANVQQFTCHGGSNQRWWLIAAYQAPGALTQYEVINVNSGKCLDVVGASTADQANVQQFTCHGGNNQRWILQFLGSGTYEIVNVRSGKCLDVVGASTADQANVQQFTCHGGNNQKWRL